MTTARVEAWQVHDTGLVVAPGPFRRLAGAVRHHRERGEPWPDQVVLTLADGAVRVTTPAGAHVGSWPAADVTARIVTSGPPVTFIVEVPTASHLLAAPTADDTSALLSALAP